MVPRILKRIKSLMNLLLICKSQTSLWSLKVIKHPTCAAKKENPVSLAKINQTLSHPYILLASSNLKATIKVILLYHTTIASSVSSRKVLIIANLNSN
jgi:hypothetical protein